MSSSRRNVGYVVFLVSLMLAGCAGPLMIVSVASTVATGKGLSEHALSAATGKDCNILGSLLEKDRDLCEEPGSPATKNDFRGLLGGDDEEVPPPSQQPILVKLGGKYVYTMSPVTSAGDLANADTVHALPTARKWGTWRDPPPAKPVLVDVHGRAVYTMAPVSRAKATRSSPREPHRRSR